MRAPGVDATSVRARTATPSARDERDNAGLLVLRLPLLVLRLQPRDAVLSLLADLRPASSNRRNVKPSEMEGFNLDLDEELRVQVDSKRDRRRRRDARVRRPS